MNTACLWLYSNESHKSETKNQTKKKTIKPIKYNVWQTQSKCPQNLSIYSHQIRKKIKYKYVIKLKSI